MGEQRITTRIPRETARHSGESGPQPIRDWLHRHRVHVAMGFAAAVVASMVVAGVARPDEFTGHLSWLIPGVAVPGIGLDVVALRERRDSSLSTPLVRISAVSVAIGIAGWLLAAMIAPGMAANVAGEVGGFATGAALITGVAGWIIS